MARKLHPIEVKDTGYAGSRPSSADRPAPKASPDPSKASTRENLDTTFGNPDAHK